MGVPEEEEEEDLIPLMTPVQAEEVEEEEEEGEEQEERPDLRLQDLLTDSRQKLRRLHTTSRTKIQTALEQLPWIFHQVRGKGDHKATDWRREYYTI